MNTRPLIGVPADRRLIDPHPFHMVGEKYVLAVQEGAGGLPFLIPAFGESSDANDIISRVDGIVLTGSPSNVEPYHYGGKESRPGTLHDPERDATTFQLIARALEVGVPLFAICRGFQELNVVLGGTLHQHVEEQPRYHTHREDPNAPLAEQYGPAHEIHLVDGGLLTRLAKSSTVLVNSLHAQGIAKLSNEVTVEAVADDGLIEAFVVDDCPGFALGVQWHPEWTVTENEFSMAMFEAFGDACRKYASSK
ncbi:MAG: peptidase C26 [Woeseia sp.]|nr:peptidase C26 [Woeseia sp.]|tara:strand:+ start:1822 stop:2574 length:753 start_codon:yes stop_codon:yes gene_type:complete